MAFFIIELRPLAYMYLLLDFLLWSQGTKRLEVVTNHLRYDELYFWSRVI